MTRIPSPTSAWTLLCELLGQDPPEWHTRAACRAPGVDPEWFWPDRGRPDTAEVARAICATCPVRAECLDDVLAQHSHTGGIWGGTNEKERRKLRQEMGLKPNQISCGNCGAVVEARAPNKRWCSAKCRQDAYVKRAAS